MGNDATPVVNLTLPDSECEWCGAVIKWVRLYPKGEVIENPTTIPIDADARNTYDPLGKLVRVSRKQAGGRIDCAMPVAAADRWRHARTYAFHRDTCPQADKWTGRKKWSAAKYKRPRESPEKDGLTPEQVAELDRIDDLLADPRRP